MPTYTILARVMEQRFYEVQAVCQEEAEELFREDFTMMQYDLVERELDEFEVQE